MTEQLTHVTPRRRLTAALPVDERRLDLAGISTAMLTGGAGTPVVLLHGPGGNAAKWLRVLPDLVARHRVVAPDLPGHGESEIGDAGRIEAWLGELIEQTCDVPPVLVGYALGGAIAARFAAVHGDRIDRLVLVDALGLVPFDPAPDFARALGDFAADPSPVTHDALWRHCVLDLDGLRERLGDRWEPFAAYNVDRARTPGRQAALRALMTAFAFEAVPPGELARIAVPTTLIWGRHDLATPVEVAEEASRRYGWDLRVIEECADTPPVERPEAFLEALRPVLATTTAAVGALRDRVRGPVLLPGDDGFADATLLWNGLIAKTPAVAVQADDAADVVAAVDFARRHGLAVSVRGGGHNLGGTALADGGVTIDMARRRGVAVDPGARTAAVESGCLLGDVDGATQAHGLAVPLGFFSEVGVAGLTLGGGLGYLTRRFGWTVDNLLEVEIVTADGAVRRASRDENADLFWGVRGAGANLGVVTSFTFALHEVGPTVYGGLVAWPFERSGEVFAAYRRLTAEAPRELSVWLLLVRAPAAPFVPPEWHGERVCAMAVCYSGAEADQALAPLRAVGEPVFDLLQPQPYVDLQSSLDATEPKGHHYDWKTEYVPELSDGLLATMRDLAAACPIPDAQIGLLHLGGAVADRAADDGVVGNRDAAFACGVIGAWEPDEPGGDGFPAWIRAAWTAVRPFSTGGNYINFQTGDEGENRIRASYGAGYERLAELKRRYDPENLFRSNRNVRP